MRGAGIGLRASGPAVSPFIKSTVALSAALVAGRLLGFLREVLLAGRLGVSAEADMAIVILTLPDFLIALLMSGGFSAALVPALRRQAPSDRLRLYRCVSSIALLVALGVAAFIALFPWQIFALLAPALDARTVEPALGALQLAAFSIPLAALSGALGALLNARGVFFVVGLGTVIYNFVICGFLLTLPAGMSFLVPLACAVIAAGTARFALLSASARVPFGFSFQRPPIMPRGLFRLFVAGVLASGIGAGAQIIFRTLAGLESPGTLTAFAYALKLYLLPVVILFTPITTVLLTRFADHGTKPGRVREEAVAVVLVVAFATFAVGMTSGAAIARLIYFRGAMTEEAMQELIFFAELMFLAVPFAGLEMVGAAWLNASARTGRVLAHASAALILGAGLAIWEPDLVMEGFLTFYVVLAVLNVWQMRLDFAVLIEVLTPMRIFLALAFFCGVFAVNRLLVTDLPDWHQAALGCGLFVILLAIWFDQLRKLRKRRAT